MYNYVCLYITVAYVDYANIFPEGTVVCYAQ